MADNYLQFAEVLGLPLEVAHYVIVLEELCITISELDSVPKTVEVHNASFSVTDSMIEDSKGILARSEEECYGAGCVLTAGNNGLYVASEESGDIELLAELIHVAMKRFGVSEAVSIEWATTCSKPRPGEFGGGAVVITKDSTHWMNSGTWVHEKIKELFPK